MISLAGDEDTVLIVHGHHLCTIRHIAAPKRLAAEFALADCLVTGVPVTNDLYNDKLAAIETVRRMTRIRDTLLDMDAWWVVSLVFPLTFMYQLTLALLFVMSA
jgi:hypothetical protein